jgi:hypothetical protein
MSTHHHPSLGPLAAVKGKWTGKGFNTIFRPRSRVTPTPLPNEPTPNTDTQPFNDPDNLLQLNLTQETLTFSDPLSDIPNRAFLPKQPDLFLQGVPYNQQITDVTDPHNQSGIHFEPGIWLFVPKTDAPAVEETVARMASIPHGTTILAQGFFKTDLPGAPNIPKVDLTPFDIGDPTTRSKFKSQNAADTKTFRLPQTLPPTITQTMLDDPNSVLRDAIKRQHIVKHTVLEISTLATAELRGSGTSNIAFLEGTVPPPDTKGPNAHTAKMTATFWIETVKRDDGTTFTQIQYSQVVLLDFDKLSWPHVSVATLTQG